MQNRILRLAFSLLALPFLAQCGARSVPSSSVRVLLHAIADIKGTRAANTYSAQPTSISGFDCYAVNIMGDGIEATGSAPNKRPVSELIANTSKCSYPGIMSPLIAIGTGGAVELTVPKGTQRLVQILGVKSPGGCSLGTSLKDRFDRAPNMVSDPIYPGVYEIGRAVVDTTSNTSVTITGNYTTPSRDVRCAYTTVDCSLAANSGATPVGSGTIGDPYKLCTLGQFAFLVANPNSKYVVEANLDFSAGPTTQIAATGSMNGSLDGQGYTWSNYSTTVAPPDNAGLIGTLSGTAQIKNFNFINATISTTTTGQAGLLVGLANSGGLIQDVNVTGTLNVSSNISDIGGLVGKSMDTLNRVSANVAVNATGSGPCSYVGGLVGRVASGGSVTYGSATGAVTADNCTEVGGLVGYLDGATGTGTLSKSFATGAVRGSSVVGGFLGKCVGVSSAMTVDNSYSSGSVTATAPSAAYGGGFLGLGASPSGSLTKAYSSTASVTVNGTYGGFAGSMSWTNSDIFSNSAVAGGSGPAGTALSAAALKQQASFPTFDFTNTWTIVENVSPPTLR